MKSYQRLWMMIGMSMATTFLFNCQSKTENKHVAPKVETSDPIDDILSSKQIPQGKISFQLTFPNLPVQYLLGLYSTEIAPASSPSTSHNSASLAHYADSALKNIPKKEFLRLPYFNSTVYFTQNEAKIEDEGFNYKAVIYTRFDNKLGNLQLINKVNPKETVDVNYQVNDLSLVNDIKPLILAKEYFVDKTGTTKKIAGFICQQSIYYKKDKSSDILPKLIIWKTPRIHKGINLLHPYVFDENEGILAIEAYLTKQESSLVRYEAKQVTDQAFSTSDFKVKNSSPILNGSELEQVKMKVQQLIQGK